MKGANMSDYEAGGNVSDTINAVTGLIKAVPVYDDVVQPAARELGKGLEAAVKLALEPLHGLVWGYERIKGYLERELPKRLQSVAPEKIIAPSPNVAVPAIEAMRYTGHQSELCELFTNLLVASMNSDSAKEAFPSFVDIVKQLTPDEAHSWHFLLNAKCAL